MIPRDCIPVNNDGSNGKAVSAQLSAVRNKVLVLSRQIKPVAEIGIVNIYLDNNWDFTIVSYFRFIMLCLMRPSAARALNHRTLHGRRYFQFGAALTFNRFIVIHAVHHVIDVTGAGYFVIRQGFYRSAGDCCA